MAQPPITLKLKSRDGEIFEVEKPVAMKINFVKNMLEDVDEKDAHEIPMGDVEASILAKVVEFCKFRHQQELNQTSADEVDRWEKAFVQIDKSTLFQLILVRLCHLSAHALRCISACRFANTLSCLSRVSVPIFYPRAHRPQTSSMYKPSST